jgi:hypothetical protein
MLGHELEGLGKMFFENPEVENLVLLSLSEQWLK